MKAQIEFTELRLTEADRDAFLERVRAVVQPEDYHLIEGMTYGLPKLIELIEQTPTLPKLRRLVFGPKTEKTRQVFPPASSDPTPAAGSTPAADSEPQPQPKAKGHGRTKASDYTSARRVAVAHPQLRAGDPCPRCEKGKVRKQAPAVILRIVGAPPISATAYEMERFHCDTCGKVFTASSPPEAGAEKSAPSVGVTVALTRYGYGLPHYRLAKLQKILGVPMPASTQWEVMEPLAQQAQPVMEELITQAAQSPLVHHDDTTMRILDQRRSNRRPLHEPDPHLPAQPGQRFRLPAGHRDLRQNGQTQSESLAALELPEVVQ
jgi:transposase